MKISPVFRKLIGAVVLLLIVLSLNGCAQASTEPPDETPDLSGELIEIAPEVIEEINNPVLTERLKMVEISDEMFQLMEPVEEGKVTALALDMNTSGVISFPGATENMIDLQTGDIIVYGITDKTPYGLLREVTDISTDVTGAEIVTEQATLEDAIENGTIKDENVILDYSMIDNNAKSYGLASVKVRPSRIFGEILINVFDEEELIEGVKAKGTIRIRPEYDFLVEIEGAHVQKLAFINKTKVIADVKIESSIDFVNLEKEKQIKIKEIIFTPKTVTVSGLPVVITPILSVYVGLKGEVSVGISTGVSNETDFRVGVEYNKDDWKVIRNLDSNIFLKSHQNLNSP